MESKMKNPFMISFSRKPVEYIDRYSQTARILDTFTTEPVTDQLFIITGIRGSGKTVLLSDIANKLEEDKKWIVIRCNQTRNILHYVAVNLADQMKHKEVAADAAISAPAVLSLGIHESRDSDDQSTIGKLLKSAVRRKQKVLITIDEVTNTQQMREFGSAFSTWIGENLPVFFIGTGLYENIMNLQNVDNMTFLYRAPKIVLGPLDMAAVALSYEKVFNAGRERSREMAKLTMGYSFAFQALGYTYWEAQPVGELNDILPQYDALLSDASYSKLWSELSEGDRKVCRAIASSGSSRVKDIREKTGMNSNQFNQYRIRLKNKGLVDISQYGNLSFTLPRFGHFIEENAFLYE